jgi:hypothetical protein
MFGEIYGESPSGLFQEVKLLILRDALWRDYKTAVVVSQGCSTVYTVVT